MAEHQFLAKLEEQKPTIEALLPSYFDKELWMLNARNMWKAIQRDEKLRACSVESQVECITEAARRGLEIGTANKHCAPVAFKNAAVLLTQWQGRVFQWNKSGAIKKLKVDIAFKGDQFTVISGDEDRIIHVPDLDAARSTAWRNNIENIIASYAIAVLWSGERVHSVCTRSYLKRIMDFVEKQKGLGNFWRDWLPEQCMKTAVNRLEGKIQPPPNMTAEQMEAWSRTATTGSIDAQYSRLPEELPPDDLPTGIENGGADAADTGSEGRATSRAGDPERPTPTAPPVGGGGRGNQPGSGTHTVQSVSSTAQPAPADGRTPIPDDEQMRIIGEFRRKGGDVGEMFDLLARRFGDDRADLHHLNLDELPAVREALGLESAGTH